MMRVFFSFRGMVSHLVEAGSKRFDIDLRYFLGSGFYLNLNTIVGAASALVLSVFFARFLSKEVFGQYSFVVSVVSIASLFALPGMRTAVVQSVARGFFGNYRVGLRICLKWSLLGSLSLAGFSLYYFFSGATALWIGFLLAAVLFSPQSVSYFYPSYLAGAKQFKTSALYFSIYSLASVLMFIAAVFLWGTLPALIGVYFLSHILVSGVFTLRIYFRLKEDLVDVEAVRFGKHLSAVEALQTVAFYADNVLVGALLGFEELAVYTFAKILPEQVKSFARNIGELALPQLSQMSKADVGRSLMRKSWQFSAVMGVLVVAYIVAAPFLYKLLFPQYSDAVVYSQALALSVTFPVILFNYAFQAHLLKRETFVGNVGSSFIQIFLLLALTPLYGLVGAVAARILGRFFSLALNIFLFKKSKAFL